MRHGTVLSLAALLLLSACAGQVHHVPRPTEAQIDRAERDVLAEPDLVTRRTMTSGEASQALAAVVRRIHPVAQQVCQEVRSGNCYWRYRFSPDRSLNAAATESGYVILNRGLAEMTTNDDEIAFVLGHELGHHAANHPATGNTNAMVGGLIGGLLGGYLGQEIGSKLGAVSYSKEQEREADYLGVVIAYRAGVDLDKARGVVLTMTRMSGKRESTMLDSHPEGAERLAGYDRAVAAVRASNGALPPRAK